MFTHRRPACSLRLLVPAVPLSQLLLVFAWDRQPAMRARTTYPLRGCF
ncbi:hypothetical protein OOT46_10155 [Aquabacterium sp. A7-Y]|nr:hypothetical protein [Aquabacterium sp. A7-Y]MCW7538210.1 hypothetical protein [Aquabacterium sp. A7-Y]